MDPVDNEPDPKLLTCTCGAPDGKHDRACALGYVPNPRPRPLRRPQLLLHRHVNAVEAAAEALWKYSMFGVAASYSGQTWTDQRVTEEVREHWRGLVRVVVQVYTEEVR